jgi:preprotein translocase subunit SecG
MTVLLLVVHALSAIMLIVVILMQSGRGGGLAQSFASAESMFGAKTNEFMIKTTAVFASIFLVTSLSLAHISSKKDRSLISENLPVQKIEIPITTNATAVAVPAEQVPESK